MTDKQNNSKSIESTNRFNAVVQLTAALISNQEALQDIYFEVGRFGDYNQAIVNRAIELVNTIEESI